MIIRPFGEIDPDNLEECYDSEIIVSGQTITLDLNFEEETITPKALESISAFINNIESHIKNAFEVLSKDFDLGDDSQATKLYFDHHVDDVSEEDLIKLFKVTQITKEIFLNALSLRRIGFYPEDSESCVIIDIKLPDDYTDYLLAVTLDQNFRISAVSMES